MGAAISALNNGWGLIKDVFFGNLQTCGAVEAPHHGREDGYRHSAAAAVVRIDGVWHYATRDIEPRLHVGTFVDAEAGAVSHCVLFINQP